VGKPCYIIAKSWFTNYKRYIFYKEVRTHSKPV